MQDTEVVGARTIHGYRKSKYEYEKKGCDCGDGKGNIGLENHDFTREQPSDFYILTFDSCRAVSAR